jgi:HAD superfamily hydrolase (TIGR01509 family)
MLRALIFDFDGLLLDTETPLLQSWHEVFDQHQVPIDAGTLAHLVESCREPPEAYHLLEAALRRPIDRESVRSARAVREAELISELGPRPGARLLINEAKATGLRTAIASNSSLSWIAPQLARLSLASSFDSIRCKDHVARVKPDPELYLAILTDLGIKGGEAVALEDSPAGAAAAQGAGVACVAVPNPATIGLTWGQVSLTVPSLESITLEQLASLASSHLDDKR